MVFQIGFPYQHSRAGVQCVHVPDEITEIGFRPTFYLTALGGFDRDGRTDLSIGFEGPAYTTRIDIQGINSAVLATHENTIASNDRLGASASRIRIGECPL